MSGRIELLGRADLVVTGPVDHADWNYRPLLGYIQRRRFRLIVDLLGPQRCARLLEIGYGSGVFLPELARHCDELAGIDIHDRPEAVAGVLAKHGVQAQLQQASVTDLPFPDAHFDCAVAVSALEYVDDIDRACAELRRVLTPGGRLVLVTPGHSWLADLGLGLLTDEDARENYADRRQRLRAALSAQFTELEARRYPRVGGDLLRLYTALCLAPRGAAAG